LGRFEVVECARKIFLVGLTVLYKQGSFEQLVLGAAGTTFLLTFFARLSPYKNTTDNLLGLLCQLVILVNLLLAMLLKGLEAEAENALLSVVSTDDALSALEAARAEREDFEGRIGLALMVLGGAPFLIAVILFFYDVYRERDRARRAILAVDPVARAKGSDGEEDADCSAEETKHSSDHDDSSSGHAEKDEEKKEGMDLAPAPAEGTAVGGVAAEEEGATVAAEDVQVQVTVQ